MEKNMRTFNILLFLITTGVLALTSCDKGELGPVASSDPGAPSITAPAEGESYTLTKEIADDTLLTFEWTEPDYGFPAAVTYSIEMASAGSEFADLVQVGTTSQRSYSVTVAGMNSMLLSADYPAGEETMVDIRVTAAIADSLEKQVSPPISLAFTPYSTCNYCPEIYVPGDYQPASGYTNEWAPADAPALTSVGEVDQYEGYVYFNDPGSLFKFTAERNWAGGEWGDEGADGTLDPGGADIEMADAGYYKINVDLNALTYTALKTTWGLIGDATAGGWDADQDMTYDPAEKVWVITTNLTAGEFKFRANDAWDLDYGDNDGDGTLEAGGSNIPVDEAGNYTIVLNLSENPYAYTLIKN